MSAKKVHENNPLTGLDVDAIIKTSLRRDSSLVIKESARNDDFNKANEIVASYADADMSWREIYELLLQNDIPPDVAKNVAKDVRGESTLAESFVAEPKFFKQVSELVSQKTKAAHVELYKNHVETFNRVSAELDTAERSSTNSVHSDFRSLKLDETYSLNAVWLHELYFAASFDPHSEIHLDSMSYIELERSWGTFDDWQKDFMACALSCGDGWAVCGFNMFLKKFVNTFVSNNSQDVMVGLYPVVVLDMHEHSYFKDYMSDKKSYIVAMMRQIDWNIVEERILKCRSLAEVLK